MRRVSMWETVTILKVFKNKLTTVDLSNYDLSLRPRVLPQIVFVYILSVFNLTALYYNKFRQVCCNKKDTYRALLYGGLMWTYKINMCFQI